MTSIYEQFDAAFKHVSAYVVLKDGKAVGRIAFKFPKDGSGRLYCYAHVYGEEMARGYATGGGYDKQSAACYVAMGRIKLGKVIGERPYAADAFKHAVKDQGSHWDRDLRDAGFEVLQAV